MASRVLLDSDRDNESDSDSSAGQGSGWPGGSDPENSDQENNVALYACKIVPNRAKYLCTVV